MEDFWLFVLPGKTSAQTDQIERQKPQAATFQNEQRLKIPH
jgi:hypothetical protein